MRKFLVVSFSSRQKYTGGNQCSKRNFESIKELYGENNVINYVIHPYTDRKKISSIINRVKGILGGYMAGLDRKGEVEIENLIKQKEITDLFIDSSLLGLLARKIKRKYPNINITTFFHNYEKGFIRDSVLSSKRYSKLYLIPLTKKNESEAIKYSDNIICLNKRDADQLKDEYGRDVDAIIPITFKSYIKSEDTKIPSENIRGLFLGSYFFGNVQGLKWFCKEVLPATNIHLDIVGASMDKFVNDIELTPQISIYSDVPDLTPFFNNADFVILPIISGSGMKVKTAESLMYGKYIIGTDEAFRGYDITESVGSRCNTTEEFITAINKLQLPYKYNKASRELFDKKYSFESSLGLFGQVLK